MCYQKERIETRKNPCAAAWCGSFLCTRKFSLYKASFGIPHLHFQGPGDFELGRRLQNPSHRGSQSLTAANQLFSAKDPVCLISLCFILCFCSKGCIILQYIASGSDFPPASFSFWGAIFQPALELLGTQLTDGLG